MHRLRTDANPRSQSGIPGASPTDDRRLIRVLGLVLVGTGAFDMGQHAMGAAFGGFAQYADFIVTQYGNNGGGEAAPANGTAKAKG